MPGCERQETHVTEIVGRIALSHAPQLIMPSDQWQDLPYRYVDGVTPPERPELAAQLTEEVTAARFQRCQDAMESLRQQVETWKPDAIIVVGDDQSENVLEDNTPPLVIYMGEQVQATLRFRYLSDWVPPVAQYKVGAKLALHLVEGLMERGFDPAWSLKTRMEAGLGHAFVRPLHFVTPNADIPVIPVMLNTYYPPAPSPKRCVQIGKALAEAVRDFPGDQRVVIMASGGLSHTKIDEELDQGFIKALESHDLDYMAEMPASELVGGTSEIRNWVVAAAAGEEGGRMIDYAPCYRQLTGIGCAMGFAVWDGK